MDLDTLAVTVSGKGRRQRTVPYGARTSQALDRYLRTRAMHPAATLTVVRDLAG